MKISLGLRSITLRRSDSLSRRLFSAITRRVMSFSSNLREAMASAVRRSTVRSISRLRSSSVLTK